MAQSGSGSAGEGGGRKLSPGDQAQPGTPGAGENTCPACAGSGKIDNVACQECSGTGVVIEGIGGG